MNEEITNTETFRALILVKVNHLHECIESVKENIKELKLVKEENQIKLAKIETAVNALIKVTWIFVSFSAGIVLTALYKTIMR